MPILNRIFFVLCFSTSAFAQTSYFAAPVPLTNTRYGALMERAADQELVATASTANTTLIVWNESGDAYLGIRARNGAWRELRLAANERAVAATGELVFTENDAGWIASWIDEQGAVLRQSSRVASFRARGVAVANDAVVVGEQEGNVMSVRIGRDGSVSEAVTLRTGAEDPAVATDGTSFLAVWETETDAIEATRLDGTNVVVFDVAAEDPAIAFNGHDYVVVWRRGPYLNARRVAADGVPVDEHVQISASGDAPRSIAVARVGDGIGLTWFDGRSQVALYDFTPRWTVRTARGFEAPAGAAPRIVALPDQRAAFVQGATHDAEPHHGSTRLTMSVAHPAPASAPDRPLVSVSKSGSRLRVAWTPPSQAVNGYRVEYRINGGPWLEQEGWIDAGTDELLLEPGRSGTFQFRLRAWSDGGTSAYSEPVQIDVTVGGRRRSVR
ncbi:MAG: hypothetical protein QOJ98_2091 [Acidobacteriota bacterium]|nr:hypothetical protein [Acidobacteriota bacterium]